ncbi:hypothetical protein [Streptosporangium carneum]|uniref:Uncharacterized protein n=1 Tax=Streptosporangium carneum TaxID=47481 RepID=A0A9W6MBX3_9ACTN|nr:hypothetical protein [Streptosporangium carneum]GLK08799.1 hypothetical protein GCM10017600_22040 [Streptosporangium carneum]
MTQTQPPVCRTCGTVVEHPGRHREWHEALERLLPGLEAELNGVPGTERPQEGFTF